MSRPAHIFIDPFALVHNVQQIKKYAPGKKVIAMVKANAYGCGLSEVVPVLEGQIDAFGVAYLEEALTIRALGSMTQCILFEGVFHPEEYLIASEHHMACIVHHAQQLEWLIRTPVPAPLKVWIKIDTGMHRLGFRPQETEHCIKKLKACPWVDEDIGLISHFACADQPEREENKNQMDLFQSIQFPEITKRSLANSAAIINLPKAHEDVVRPGIMLYGVSPFTHHTSIDLGLRPVMHFKSAVIAIHHNPAFAQVGYGGTWRSDKKSTIAIVAAGYGDGYPRHIKPNTPVWLRGREVPIVGRVSMDMMAINITDHEDIVLGDEVELWGSHILVERIAQSAGTIGYELLCQITDRIR